MDYAVDSFPSAIPYLLRRGAEPTLQTHIVRCMTVLRQKAIEFTAL
jgi:hypothetical protein